MATFAAGQRLPASKLVTLTGFATQTAVGTCNGILTLGTSLADVPGCSVTVSITGANAYALVTANVQFVVTVASAGVALSCALLVDGVNQLALGTVKDTADAVHEGHRSYMWKVPLAAGSHTLKLQGSKGAAGSTSSISNTWGTNIVVQVYDLP